MKYLTFTLLLLIGTSLHSKELTPTYAKGGDYIITSVGSAGFHTTTILNIKTQEVFVIKSSLTKDTSFYKKKLIDFKVTEKN